MTRNEIYTAFVIFICYTKSFDVSMQWSDTTCKLSADSPENIEISSFLTPHGQELFQHGRFENMGLPNVILSRLFTLRRIILKKKHTRVYTCTRHVTLYLFDVN